MSYTYRNNKGGGCERMGVSKITNMCLLLSNSKKVDCTIFTQLWVSWLSPLFFLLKFAPPFLFPKKIYSVSKYLPPFLGFDTPGDSIWASQTYRCKWWIYRWPGYWEEAAKKTISPSKGQKYSRILIKISRTKIRKLSRFHVLGNFTAHSRKNWILES